MYRNLLGLIFIKYHVYLLDFSLDIVFSKSRDKQLSLPETLGGRVENFTPFHFIEQSISLRMYVVNYYETRP